MNFLIKIFQLLICPNFENLKLANVVFFCAVLGLGLLIGSAVSVFVISAIIYGYFHLASGNIPREIPYSVKLVSLALAAIFFADMIASIAHPSGLALIQVIEGLPFLGLPALYAVIYVDREKLMSALELVSSLVAIVLTALLQAGFISSVRPEFMAGNTNVAALLSSLLFSFTIVGVFRKQKIRLSIIMIGAIASSYLILVSETRAIWPALIVVPAVAISVLVLGTGWKKLLMVARLFGLFILVLSTNLPSITARLLKTSEEYVQIQSGNLSGSIGQRLAIYRVGIDLFKASPVFGYGPGNERRLLSAEIKKKYGKNVAYSHSHNLFVNQSLRSGIFGLVALLLVLIVPISVGYAGIKDEEGRAGFAVLCSVLATYLLSGVFGIFIGHDIHDSVFISSIAYSLYLIFGRIHGNTSAARTPAARSSDVEI